MIKRCSQFDGKFLGKDIESGRKPSKKVNNDYGTVCLTHNDLRYYHDLSDRRKIVKEATSDAEYNELRNGDIYQVSVTIEGDILPIGDNGSSDSQSDSQSVIRLAGKAVPVANSSVYSFGSFIAAAKKLAQESRNRLESDVSWLQENNQVLYFSHFFLCLVT